MKSYRRLGWSNPRVIACLIALGMAFLPAATVQAAPQYDFSCDACHRLPPLDSDTGGREPETGAVKGNHESHAGATAASCVKCHGPELSATGHRDKRIQVQGNLNASPAGAVYNRVVFFNQTSVPPNPLGTCSNVNCHFEAETPAWGERSYSTPAACGACHGAAPADGSHPALSGPGKKHGDYYGTGVDSCARCHPDHQAEPKPFAHASSAGQRPLQLRFSALPNSGGSYSKSSNLQYPNYLPSQTPAAARNGSCSGMYCHSNGLPGGLPLQEAVWGGSLRADCSGCHGGNALSASRIETGSHGQHLGGKPGSNYACSRCHSATVAPADDLTLPTDGLIYHVNGSAEVAFSDGGGYAALSCSSTICHSAGKSGAPSPAPVLWGGAALSCSGCHGANGGTGGFVSRFGEPNYRDAGTAGAELANSHSLSHVTDAASCVNCHAGTTGDGLSILEGSTLHSDGRMDVSFPALYDLGGAAYDGAPGVKSCSNTYCHSDGNNGAPLQPAQWGGSKSGCRSCHGGDSAGAAVTSFQHAPHMNNYSTLGRGNNLACAECHAQTVAFGNNSSVTNPASHLNRFKEYSGVRAGGNAGYQNRVCSNVYCHSSGQATPVFRIMTGSKAWDRSAKLDCSGCHGYGPGEFAPVAGEPNYPNRPEAANSHRAHTRDAGMADSRGCAVCHRSTVDRGVAGKLRDYSSAHLDGSRNVSFAVLGNYSGQYSAGTGSCSNTYCHGTGSSAAWGSGPLSCTDCHKADATLSGAHGSHWEGGAATSYSAAGNQSASATQYNFACSSCHGGVHGLGPDASGNAAEVFFNYTATGLSGSYRYGGLTARVGTLQWSNGNCSATYCHSQGEGSEGFGSAGMDWASPRETLSCNGCHGGDLSQANPIQTNLHKNHLDPEENASLGAGNGLFCAACHAQTVGFANNSTVIDKRRHVNKFRDYSGVLAGGSANYNAQQKSCSDIYCHSNGKRDASTRQFRNPGSWESVTVYGCNDCHGQAQNPDFASQMALGAPNYANSGLPGSAGSNSHKLHLEKMALSSANACYVCHARTMDRYAASFRPYSTQHLSGQSDISFGRFSSAGFKLLSSVSKASYNAETKSCSTVACHSNGRGGYQNATWGGSSNCALCHALNKLSRGHAFHIYTGAANIPLSYDNYTANRSDSGVAPGRYNYGCANCHPVNNPEHTKGKVLIDLYPGSANVVGSLRSRNGASITVGRVPAGTAGSGTTVAGGTLTCDNVYCHSNGYQAQPVYATTPDWYAGSFSGDRCANCHGNSPNSDPVNLPGSPSHLNQNWLGTGTEGGHFMGIHAKSITDKGSADSQESFIGLLSPAAVEPASHGVAASSSTISCNSCHWETIQTSANFGSAQCNGCHGGSAARASISDKGKHINGRAQVAFQPSQVRSKAQLRDVSFAQISSATLWHRNGVYKSATGYDSSKLPLSAGSWSGANCSNVVCHFNNPVPWTVPAGTSVSCESCHNSM